MNFKQYIDDSWAQHDKQPDELLKNYDKGLSQIETEADVLAMARLIHHVATDHNFKFDDAKVFLEQLKNLPLAQSVAVLPTLDRNIKTMQFLKDPSTNLSDLTHSDLAMVHIIAAASNLFQKKFEKVDSLMDQALAAANQLLPTDPASRILAMSNNNMAVELSEKAELNETQKKLMIRAAHNSRKYWEMAGTWLQVERCEYDLSKYYLKLNQVEKAKHHADLCFEICKREKAEPLEFFFAHERFALICKSEKDQSGFEKHLDQMKKFYSLCSEKDQTWLKEPLAAAQAA